MHVQDESPAFLFQCQFWIQLLQVRVFPEYQVVDEEKILQEFSWSEAREPFEILDKMSLVIVTKVRHYGHPVAELVVSNLRQQFIKPHDATELFGAEADYCGCHQRGA